MLEHLTEILNQVNLNYLLVNIIVFYFLYFLTTSIWCKNNNFLLKNFVYSGPQIVHHGEIPRLGGLILYLTLFIFSLYVNNQKLANYLQLTCLCSLPMFLLITKEDIYHNVHYKLRLLCLSLTCMALIFYVIDDLPSVNHIILISDFFQNPLFSFVFFALCLLVLANGFNFIDGMNGHLSLNLFGMLFCCIELSYIVQDTYLGALIALYFLLTFCFFVLNFPFGKIFFGDFGAYLMALLIGIWIINFFGTYKFISSWNAVLIFFYPIAEVLYSVTRKLYQKKSPFFPDREHLHLKVYDNINTSLNRPKLSNNLTTIFLSFFALSPPLLLPWVFVDQLLIFVAILMFTLIYITLNIFLPPRY